jgi:glucose-like phosphotransferase system IIB component
MITKADYQASKSGEAETADAGPVGSKIPADRRARLLELEENLGGLDNLEVIDACITRLRITVTDRSKLNDDALKAMGAMGIVGNGKAVQVIFGAEADRFKQELKALRAERAEGN